MNIIKNNYISIISIIFFITSCNDSVIPIEKNKKYDNNDNKNNFTSSKSYLGFKSSELDNISDDNEELHDAYLKRRMKGANKEMKNAKEEKEKDIKKYVGMIKNQKCTEKETKDKKNIVKKIPENTLEKIIKERNLENYTNIKEEKSDLIAEKNYSLGEIIESMLKIIDEKNSIRMKQAKLLQVIDKEKEKKRKMKIF